ncbi:uncharacterized protein LOC106668459 isoform X2 [Cimex lectularius]|nr:uncharacterized protein LOC106668459 isoform X2 [Cimex lectularius]
MTWSGWMPGSGMSVFASSEDPWGQPSEGFRPPNSMGNGWSFEGPGTFGDPSVKQFDEDQVKPKPVEDEKEHKPIKPFHSKPRKSYDDEYDDRRHSGSNANASFNAWFPIMLGMYPGSDTRTKGSDQHPDDRGSVAAIANSVNHGRSGVASSHAIVYSGQQPNNRNSNKF